MLKSLVYTKHFLAEGYEKVLAEPQTPVSLSLTRLL